jgi:YegS/Rv2252/BmrU family lipid kinase
MTDHVRGSPLFVVLNPASGGGAGRRVRGELEMALRARNLDAQIELTRGRGHATELAVAAAEAGAPVVVAAGGDGTVHEVVNGLLRSQTPPVLGLIPIGTGNDFVKVVPGTRRRPAAYDTLARGEVRRFDAARARWSGGSEFFVNAAGTGIDVEVVRQIEALGTLPGALKYLVGLMRALARYRAVRMRVTPASGGAPVERRVMLSAVSNGSCLGGAFRLTPDAQPDDGLLDLCVVEELALGPALRVVSKVLRGRHAADPSVTMLRDRAFHLEIDAGGPVFLQLDGELRRIVGDSVHMEVIPGALRVVSGD